MTNGKTISCLMLLMVIVASSTEVCKLTDMEKKLVKEKPKMNATIGKFTPRSIFKGMNICTTFEGDIKVNSFGAKDRGQDEFVRSKDLDYLKYLKKIYGNVELDLTDYKDITNLSFFNGVDINYHFQRTVNFTLQNSQVTHLFPPKYKIESFYINLFNNTNLCYLDGYNPNPYLSIVKKSGNKPSEKCKEDGQKCDSECSSCSGPGTMRFVCNCKHFSYNDLCVSRCPDGTFLPGFFNFCWNCTTYPSDNLRYYFTDKTGWKTCGLCNEYCSKGCTGPTSKDCFQCANYKYFYDKNNKDKFDCVLFCPRGAIKIQNSVTGKWKFCNSSNGLTAFSWLNVMVIALLVSKFTIS